MKNKKLYSSLLAFSLVFTQVSGNFVNVYAEEKIDDVVEVTEENTTEKENSDVQKEETTTTDETQTDESVQEETKTDEKTEQETKESQPEEEQKVEKKVEVKKEVKAEAKVSEVKASYTKAVDSILLPKYNEQGKKVEQHVTDTLKSHLVTTDLVATKDTDAKTLTFKTVQLKDVYLDSDYVNGKSEAGKSFYNMLNYYTSVKQVKQLLDENKGYTVIDSKKNFVDEKYVNELLGLLDQINDIDPTTKLKYDMNSVWNSDTFKNEKQRGGTDVIATSKEGNVTLRFHIDSHGWWGYDLGAHDSITGVVMGYDAKTAYNDQRALTTKYGHFFVIDMGYTANNDKCYMLNGTDLENPMIYVSADKTKAFMIDVDMYGQNVINSVIKSVIGDQCKELNIFLTHLHPDHVNNLEVIAKDSKLKSITKIIWPKNEQFTVDVQTLFGKDNVKTIADYEKVKFSETTFQFIEIPDEHTPGGGQLADLSNKINYVGDTLGAQVHLGGTTVAVSQLDSWIAGMEKTETYTKENGIEYFVGGHTPYLNNTAFATWVKTACEHAKKQMTKDISWKGGNIVVENNNVVTGDRLGQIFSQGLTDREELNVASVNFRNDIVTNVKASYDKAINEVTFPKYEKSGVKTDVHVSDLLKKHLDTKDLTAVKNSKDKTIKVDVQLKDLTLNSDYLNGKSEAGISFYNMVNYFTDVKQIKQLLDKNEGYTVLDNNGNEVNAAYINELLGLIEQIMQFDTSTNLKYDMDSVYDSKVFEKETKRGGTDVIATSKEGNVTLKFHIDAHGWWGYDLGADDSITALVMGYDQEAIDADHAEHESPITRQYGNFFVIEMENKGPGKWYMINNTDLENPMIYVSEDGKEAFMIDVDFYGENVLNKVIKDVIGDKCESLKIFCTHNHGDHVNNLAVIAKDERLKDITTIIWPENEPHTVKDNVDLVELFKNETIKDMEKIKVAGNEFQFIEILNEHTPAGGQLADLTNKVIYSGDSLGAQVHLGGTNIAMSNADNWLAGCRKVETYIKENGIKYNIGGHTPYLNTSEFASWLAATIEYAKAQFKADPKWAGGLVIAENGKVINGTDRMGEMFSKGVSDREELNVCSVNFRNDSVYDLKADYDKAISEVTFPKYEKDGTKNDVHVSALLKEHLDTEDLEAQLVVANKTIKVDVQLKDLTLNSDYVNGKSEAGISFYNMVNYFTDVKQIKQLLDKNEGYSVVDSKGNKVNAAYINELLGLIEQIMQFDTSTNLKYDMDSVYDADKFKEEVKRGGTDVIATSKEGNVTLKFHIDSHGWWGYDLGADDSITALVMGYDQEAIDADHAEHESPITRQYGNFFVIEMENKGPGKWYMINNTDLENPMIYVSEDGKEAFMIDVDFYGENVLNKVIKDVIGDKCESLKIFCTHNHGDHVNNLAVIAKDERLKDITTIIWPENEPHTVKDNVDLVELFKNETIKDMEKIKVAGNEFQFIQIPNEHTPAGGQLADLTNKVVYCGDSLGAQVHLGGTTITADKAQAWLDGANKSYQYMLDNDMKYYIGGHTPYLNTREFSHWLATGIEYAMKNAQEGYNLIVVENNEVLNGTDRFGEVMGNGLTDREELNICSLGYILPKAEDPTKPEEPQKPEVNDPEKPEVKDDTNKDKKDPKTGDQTMIAGYALTALTTLAGLTYVASKKKKEEE